MFLMEILEVVRYFDRTAGGVMTYFKLGLTLAKCALSLC